MSYKTTKSILGLAALLLATASCTDAQSRFRGRAASTLPPPIANSEAEKRILATIDQARRAGEVYLEVEDDSGRLMRLLIEASGARNVVEIGTSTGYSGLWLSLALQKTGGKLTTFEIDPGRAAMARKHFDQAGVGSIITVVQGDAHVNIKQLKEPIHFLFLDADKEGYNEYLTRLLPLLAPGAIIVADNVERAPDYFKAVTTNPALDTVSVGRTSVTIKKR